MAKRLTNDLAAEWVFHTLVADERDSKEQVVWDVSVVAYPDPGNENGAALLPALVLYLEIPAIEESQSVYISTLLAPYQLTEATVKKSVDSALKKMREHRKSLLDNPESESTLPRTHSLEEDSAVALVEPFL